MAKPKLSSLVAQILRGSDYVPNAPDSRQKVTRLVISESALVSLTAMEIQQSGGDLSAFSEEEWRDVLADQLGVDEFTMADRLEEIAAWGVVEEVED